MSGVLEDFISGREQVAAAALRDTLKFFRVVREIGCDAGGPSSETLVLCRELAALYPEKVVTADNDRASETPPQMHSSPTSDSQGTTGNKPGPDRAGTQVAKRSRETRRRGPGDRSPAGTVTGLVTTILGERPGEEFTTSVIVEMMVARGWYRPLRANHSVYQALLRLSGRQGSGIRRVGAGLWRYTSPDTGVAGHPYEQGHCGEEVGRLGVGTRLPAQPSHGGRNCHTGFYL